MKKAIANWCLYLIECENHAYYCGISTDALRRWQQHLTGKGAKYTRANRPVKMKVLQDALTHSQALKIEAQIKKLPHSRKQILWETAAVWFEINEVRKHNNMYTVKQVNQSGLMKVSDIHQMYWEDCGNPNGKPVIFLHGGPGGGSSPATRGFFNPDVYRIIQIDQRGCGKSLPHACVQDNDTWKIIADIEALREHLGIDKWMVFGGSWGSTLSLLYAQKHPERVSELVLRGIFLFRDFESDWLYKRGGASQIFPEAWEAFENFIASEKRGDLIQAYHDILFGQDVEATLKIQAARHWCEWEEHIVLLHPQKPDSDDGHALAISSMENHYFYHRGFIGEDQAILKHIDKIRHIPTIIVQGRYDICTPIRSAYDLKQAFPEADLRVVIGGHSSFDVEVNKGLVAATDEFAKRID